jgi:hypothetical protein
VDTWIQLAILSLIKYVKRNGVGVDEPVVLEGTFNVKRGKHILFASIISLSQRSGDIPVELIIPFQTNK